MSRTADDIRFDALRNAIYHSSRASFLTTLNRFLSFIVVISGAGAVSDVGRLAFDIPAAWFALVATVAGALQLVFDFGSRARVHEVLQRRFYELASEVAGADAPSDDMVRKWDSRLKLLYAEESTPMRALDAISYNAALESLGWNPAQRIRVRWWHTLLGQFWPFNQTAFDYVGASKAGSASPSA